MINKTIGVLVVFLFLTAITFAQDKNTSETTLTQIKYNFEHEPQLNSFLTSGTNNSLIVQVGSHNLSEVTQTQTDMLSSSNYFELLQLGSHNSAKVTQYGVNNNAIWEQSGDYNSNEVEFIGNDNSSILFQYGNSNTVQQSIFGSNLEYQVEQYGNNNEFIQVENSGFGTPLSIIQKGNGITIKTYNGGFVR